MEMWTEKYRPKSIKDIVGQKKAIDETVSWLSSWRSGSGALLFHGPPGCGKTALAEAIAAERGWMLMRLNASDRRSVADIDRILESVKTESLFHSGKIVLIDEVDGISGGERGAVPAIIRLIKSSRFPVILVANDPWKQRLAPLRQYAKMVKFNKIMTPSIEKKLREICTAEGITVQGNVLKNLARWSQGDMRSAINDLQTVCQGRKEISDRDLEALGFRERKNNVFNLLPTILRSGNINAARKAISDMDKDADEILLWIENNIHLVVKNPENLSKSFELLSNADILRNRVSTQQNWRFKALMSDLMACISLFKDDAHYGFVPYQAPMRISMLGRTKKKRAETDALCEKIGLYTHTSKRRVKWDYLRYLKIIARKKVFSESKEALHLSREELKVLKNA